MKWGLSMNKIDGLNATLAVGSATWLAPEPVYVTTQSIPTFSFFEKSLAIAPTTISYDFAQEIASIFASLSEGQQPLGAEFEAVWDANLDALFQS